MRILMIIALGCLGSVLPACDSDSPGSGGSASDSFIPSGPPNDTQSAPNDTQSAGAEQIPNDTQTAPNDTQHMPWNSPAGRGSVTVVVSGAGGTSSTSTENTGGTSSTSTQHTGGSSSTTTTASCTTSDGCAKCAADSCAWCQCYATLYGYPTSTCSGIYC